MILDHFDHFWQFLPILIQNFSGRFDTSGSMIRRLVPEILPCDAFCDEQEQEQEQELGILGLKCMAFNVSQDILLNSYRVCSSNSGCLLPHISIHYQSSEWPSNVSPNTSGWFLFDSNACFVSIPGNHNDTHPYSIYSSWCIISGRFLHITM